jgi:3-hydroxyacyl-[acyl-carrier-protein] dehydratase
MLFSDFCQLDTISVQSLADKTMIEAEIVLKPTHPIFKGHFPNLPVVPGVCMVQIVKEIAEKQLNRKLFLATASNIKFLAVLNPEIHHQVNVEVQLKPSGDNAFGMESKLYFGGVTFFKMKAEFLVQPKSL